MYCISSALTVFQSRRCSRATSRMVECSAATDNVESKAFGVERIISQPLKPLLLHSSAAPAVDPTVVELKVDARAPTRQISDTAQFAVIPTVLYPATNSARRFFERRVSRIT